MNCPKCDADISDSFQPEEPDVNVGGGWYCDACDLAIAEHEVEREHFDDDVPIGPLERDPNKPLGTPISQLSGRPGHPGYEEFKRIAKSYGYD